MVAPAPAPAQSANKTIDQCLADFHGCMTTSTLAPAPRAASAPAPRAPVSVPSASAAVLSTGQALQTAEIDISTAPPAFKVPKGVDTKSGVSYTMSMDVRIDQVGNSWRNIFNNGLHDCCDATSRRPAVFITGKDASPPNRIHIVHGSDEDNNRNIVTQFAASPGVYFNLTWVVDGNKLTTYINGNPDPAGSITGKFNWGSFPGDFNWNQYLKEYKTRADNTAGPVKVKNVYWFNKALTPAEIKTISSSSSGAGTSGYAMEGSPFGGVVGTGRNTKLILTLLVIAILLWILAKNM